MTEKEALKLALEAWPCVIAKADFSENTVTLVMQCTDYKVSSGNHWLSTTTPQRTWVGLNWDDLPEIYVGDTAFLHGAKWAEAKLREKNSL